MRTTLLLITALLSACASSGTTNTCVSPAEKTQTVGVTYSVCPTTQLADRSVVMLCNSLENAGTPLVKVRVDGDAPVMGSGAGDVLAKGQCIAYQVQAVIKPLCISDTAGTIVTSLECLYGTVESVRLAVPLVGMNFSGVSTITSADDAGIDINAGAGGVDITFGTANSVATIYPSSSGNTVYYSNETPSRGTTLLGAASINNATAGGMVGIQGGAGSGTSTGGGLTIAGGTGGNPSDGGVGGNGGQVTIYGGLKGNIWGIPGDLYLCAAGGNTSICRLGIAGTMLTITFANGATLSDGNGDGGVTFSAPIDINVPSGGSGIRLSPSGRYSGLGAVRLQASDGDAGTAAFGASMWAGASNGASNAYVSATGSTATGAGGTITSNAGSGAPGQAGGSVTFFSGGSSSSGADAGWGSAGNIGFAVQVPGVGGAVNIGTSSAAGAAVEIGKAGNNLVLTFSDGTQQRTSCPVCTVQGQTLFWEGDAGVWRCSP